MTPIRNGLLIALAPTLLLSSSPPRRAPACPLFVLRAPHGEAPVLESRTLAPGSMEVLSRDTETDLLDVILPVSPGRSASVPTREDGALYILRCDGDTLHLTIRKPSGEERPWPDRPLEELRAMNVRVNVTGGDGPVAAFVIGGWETVSPDTIGPVKDLFGGKVPLGPNDFVVTTETYARSTGPAAEGEVPLAVADHLTVPMEAFGRPARAYLDLGGAVTLVSRAFLPDSVEVVETNMVEYSGAGRRLLDYAPHGATGTVNGVAGIARLPLLRVGSVEFRDVEVVVMDRLPDWFPEGVVGILGLDLVRRARSATLELPRGEGEEGRLLLAGPGDPLPALPSDAIRVPFVLSSHLFVRGRIRDRVVHFILDTGAPRSFLDESGVGPLGLDPQGSRTVHGLDDKGAEVAHAEATLELGGREFRDMPFEVGAMAPFDLVRRSGQIGGLLGNEFFRRFRRVVLDFERGELLLVP